MSKFKSGIAVDGDSLALLAIAQDLLLREANALDTQQWDEWLALYSEDAVFWLPAWIDEHEVTSNVNETMSNMYHEGRLELSERVARIVSNKSATAMPLPRTMHLVGAPFITMIDGDEMTVRSNATVHVYDTRTTRLHVTASRYEHVLGRHEGETWLIRKKKIILINDCMPSVMDFYAI